MAEWKTDGDHSNRSKLGVGTVLALVGIIALVTLLCMILGLKG